MPCLTARVTGRSAGGVLRERVKADGLRARFTGKVYGQIAPCEMRTPLLTGKNDPKMSDI